MNTASYCLKKTNKASMGAVIVVEIFITCFYVVQEGNSTTARLYYVIGYTAETVEQTEPCDTLPYGIGPTSVNILEPPIFQGQQPTTICVGTFPYGFVIGPVDPSVTNITFLFGTAVRTDRNTINLTSFPMGEACFTKFNKTCPTLDFPDFCGDGNFCNGRETCLSNGLCLSPGSPCLSTQCCDAFSGVCGNQSSSSCVFPTGPPTLAPTVSPSKAPTRAPTLAPTVAPSKAPTATPTVAPTVAPSKAPTVAPTAAPTVAPTRTPTVAPTTTPTIALSNAPTVAPTVAPTATPSNAPTRAPTVAPTALPSKTPTRAPSVPPTRPLPCHFCTYTQQEYSEECNTMQMLMERTGGQDDPNATCQTLTANWDHSKAACVRDLCFRAPIILGAPGGFMVIFTNSDAIKAFLMQHGRPRIFTTNATNPPKSTPPNRFAAELVTALMNVIYGNITFLRFSSTCSDDHIDLSIRDRLVLDIINISQLVIAGFNVPGFTAATLTRALALYNTAFDCCRNSRPDCFTCQPTAAPSLQASIMQTSQDIQNPGFLWLSLLVIALVLFTMAILYFSTGTLRRRSRFTQ